MLVQPRCVRVTAAKSSREEPKPTPEPARRILGRVGGLSVARQRQLLSQWKARWQYIVPHSDTLTCCPRHSRLPSRRHQSCGENGRQNRLLLLAA